MKIILTGFMGAGKSTVGLLLSEKLGVPLIETDDLVLAHSGRGSISEIFEKDGEEHFRALELAVAGELRERGDCVISTGGGLGVNEAGLKKMRSGGTVVFLDTSFETAKIRLGNEKSRPKFEDKKAAEALFAEREAAYRRLSNVAVPTDGRTPDEVAGAVLATVMSTPPL